MVDSILRISLLVKPSLETNSIDGSNQNLALFSALKTWICFLLSSLEKILKVECQVFDYKSLSFSEDIPSFHCWISV